MEEIKALPADEQRELAEYIAKTEMGRAEWEKQKVILRDMQARHAGSGMLARLLEERNKDRMKERARG